MNTELSRGWRYSVVLIMLAGFGVLIWIAVNTYTGHVGPPIPGRVVDAAGQTVFTGATSSRGSRCS